MSVNINFEMLIGQHDVEAPEMPYEGEFIGE